MEKNRRKTEYERIRHTTINKMNFFVADIGYRTFHTHTDLELIQILSGSLHVQTKTEEFDLSIGDVAIFNPNMPHACHSNEATPCCILVLQIDLSFCQSYFPTIQNINFKTSSLSSIVSSKALEEVKRICFHIGYNYFAQRTGFEFRCISDINRLFSYFLIYVPYQYLSDSEYYSFLQVEQRTRRILNYIQEHYQEKLSLADIAQRENLTTSYVSHFFKKNLNQSFQSYLNDLRFEHALYLIQKTDMKLVDICIESGFSDSKYLNKMFKSIYNITPNEYRKLQHFTTKSDSVQDSSPNEYIYSISEGLSILKNNHYFQCDDVPVYSAKPL